MPEIEDSLLGETLHNKDMQDTTDEADETLSLCDLPLYSDQSVEEWEEDLSFDQSQGSSSMSSSEQDYFEFLSQELSHPSSSFPPENIIFCGKIIPYRQPDTSEKDSSKLDESIKKQTNIKRKRGWSIFRWKFGSRRSTKKQVESMDGKKTTVPTQKKNNDHVSRSLPQSPKKMHSGNKHGKGYDFPVHKMSVLTSSSSGKARWYLFLFGISRFSNEMELRDIKSRQSRRHCPSPPPSPVLRFQNDDKKVSGGRNSGSGLWGLIKVLSCGGNHHPNTMVVASMGCPPRE